MLYQTLAMIVVDLSTVNAIASVSNFSHLYAEYIVGVACCCCPPARDVMADGLFARGLFVRRKSTKTCTSRTS
jgi:hypothetical protein